ncbi:hypothetical protein SmJEL517_g05755 [Synchytrium microbalum]|uniref:DNA repair protein RAD5 n=1 Tax=Synchytrium microbalum TaxID=1806994 RepID=A0A507BY51_9FUNG|nr:uncharacterized protein SmJEL517_g05755 [Synchytrium microbalum]TPX30734.1 hypothetical protein SmJEL517_g05755 [Synchytrium microbalum]
MSKRIIDDADDAVFTALFPVAKRRLMKNDDDDDEDTDIEDEPIMMPNASSSNNTTTGLTREQQEAADEAYARQLALQFANGSYDDADYYDARKQLEEADALYAMQLQQEFDGALPQHPAFTSQADDPVKNGPSTSGVRGSMEDISDQDLNNAIEREENAEANGEEDDDYRSRVARDARYELARRARRRIVEQDEEYARKLQAEFDKEMNGNPASFSLQQEQQKTPNPKAALVEPHLTFSFNNQKDIQVSRSSASAQMAGPGASSAIDLTTPPRPQPQPPSFTLTPAPVFTFGSTAPKTIAIPAPMQTPIPVLPGQYPAAARSNPAVVPGTGLAPTFNGLVKPTIPAQPNVNVYQPGQQYSRFGPGHRPGVQQPIPYVHQPNQVMPQPQPRLPNVYINVIPIKKEGEDGEPVEKPLDELGAAKELVNLLKNFDQGDITPKDERITTPRQMKIALLEHQKLGVEWMLNMERGSNKGGILADDMGLGKTIQTLALCCLNPSPDNKRKTTLIVAPMSLITQWEDEISKKVKRGTFSVYVHHGSDRLRRVSDILDYDIVITTYSILALDFPEPAKTRKGKTAAFTAEDRQAADDEEFNEMREEEEHKKEEIKLKLGPLLKAQFYRVVLDEAQTIKNKATRGARAAIQLKSQFRWCLSGTPIQNNIGELYPLISFLGIPPYADWDEFREKVMNPFKRGRHKTALKRVHAILKGLHLKLLKRLRHSWFLLNASDSPPAMCLRRTKDMQLDGQPITVLPPRNVLLDAQVFTTPERQFYDALEKRIRLKFNTYVKRGTVMKNYTNVLVLLLRLRQACCHASLVANSFEKGDPEELARADAARGDAEDNDGIPMDEQTLAQHLDDKVYERLKNEDFMGDECGFCLDSPMMPESSSLISVCGHVFCTDCIAKLFDGEGTNNCPKCRCTVNPSSLIKVKTLFEVHPELEKKDDGDGDDEDDDELGVLQSLVTKFVSSAKIDRTVQVLDEVRASGSGDKTIIFSQFVGMLDLIEIPLRNKGYKFVRYDGSMSSKQRALAIKQFSYDPKCTVALISLKCGSLGLNLTCANRVILLDLWWNPALENQAIDRVHRFGQQKEVFVNRITIANSIEDRIQQLQHKKQKIFSAALDGGVLKMKKDEGRLTLEDLILLFNGEETDIEEDGHEFTLGA